MTANPFAAPLSPFSFLAPAPLLGPASARAPDLVYALVQSGPPVAAEEIECELEAARVTVRWGTQTMTIAHLSRGQSFTLGDGGDFVVPEEHLGSDKLAVVVPRGDAFFANVPGRGLLPVTHEAPVEVAFGPITVEVLGVRAGKKIPLGLVARVAGGVALALAVSAFGHGALLASVAFFMPSVNADDAEAIDRTQLLEMRALLDASAERERERIQAEAEAASDDAPGGGSTGGEPHQGDEGVAGTPKPVTTRGHMSFKGTDAAPQLSRREERDLAATFGLVGMLNAATRSTGPSSPWVTTEHAGTEAEDRMGRLFGAEANDELGTGLGLSSTGEGGGGKGAGIGLDGFGDLIGGGGHGPGKWGIGRGDKDGVGNGHGRVPGAHASKAPIFREAPVTVNGRLPADAIQRVVRLNFGKFRMCYEDALRNNPALTGRVVASFVIARDGSVALAQDGGSDLPDQKVVSCIVRGFQNLSFPTPENGQVMVKYPLTLTPGA